MIEASVNTHEQNYGGSPGVSGHAIRPLKYILYGKKTI